MTNTTDTRDQAAEEYCASTYGRFSGSYNAFIAGADWQRAQDDTAHMAKVLESREPYAPPSDDAWRATLQATINQQAEEIEALRTSTEKLRRMLAVNMAERDELREAARRLIAMVKVGTGAA